MKPLEVQFAEIIRKSHTIKVVKDTGNKKIIPFIWTGEKFEEDADLNIIRQLIHVKIRTFLIDSQDDNSTINMTRNDEIISLAAQESKEIILMPVRVYDKLLTTISGMSRLSTAVLNCLLMEPSLAGSMHDLDNAPNCLATPAGYLDLETKEIVTHFPENSNTRITSANYRPGNKPATFLRVITAALHNSSFSPEENEKRVTSFMEILSTFLIGGNPNKFILVLVGPTHTGKSLLIIVLMAILGDYASDLHLSKISTEERKKGDLRPELVDASTTRLLTISESDAIQKIDAPLLKTLTGNDILPFRKKRSDSVPFVFMPKLIIATNTIPHFPSDDEALIGRLLVVDFRNSVPKEKQISDLDQQLLEPESRDAIFSLLVDKAHEYLENGEKLNVHPSFLANQRRLVLERGDLILDFWNAEVKVSESTGLAIFQSRWSVQWLYQCFRNWCRDQGIEKYPSYNPFAKRLKEIAQQYPGIKGPYGRDRQMYSGIDLPNFEADPYITKYRLDDALAGLSDSTLKRAIDPQQVAKMMIMKNILENFRR